MEKEDNEVVINLTNINRMKKKFITLLMVAVMAFGTTTTVLAEEGTEVSVANETENEVKNVVQQESSTSKWNTVKGNAGSSWVYLKCVDTMQSQASFGINCKYNMTAVAWGLAYSDQKTASGLAFPLSKNWSGEKVKKHSSRGTISVTFTATATTLDGRVLNSLMPSSAAYIH